MQVKQAFFYSEKFDEYLIVTANKNDRESWYDYLPIRLNIHDVWDVLDHGEFPPTLKSIPSAYKRMKKEDVPMFVQKKAEEELR